MVTANLQLNQPAAGSLNWDVPLNVNFGLVDSALGGVANVGLSNLPITLSGAQYQCGLINFTGTLTGNVVVTFPVFGRVYWLQNNCVDNTTFTVTCKTTSSTIYVALPPNEPVNVLCDGTNMKFTGLERVGTYFDFAGSAVPGWITATVPAPYLNCDGTVFSSATYPALRDYLGGVTLPDARGRFRAALNQGTGRLTGASGTGGLDGNTFLASGGSQTIAIGNIPNATLSSSNLTVASSGLTGSSSGLTGGSSNLTGTIGTLSVGIGTLTSSIGTLAAGIGTLLSSKGTLSGESSNLTVAITDPGHSHTVKGATTTASSGGWTGFPTITGQSIADVTTSTAATNITASAAGTVSMTGNPVLSGTPALSGNPVLAGSPTLSGTPGVGGTVPITGTVAISGTGGVTGGIPSGGSGNAFAPPSFVHGLTLIRAG